MKILGINSYWCLLFVSLSLLSCQNKQADGDVVLTDGQKIAAKNGFNKWEDLKEISFTFNVERNGQHKWRSWTYQPKTGDIVMTNKARISRFNENRLHDTLRMYHSSFVNDIFWLTFPMQLKNDINKTISATSKMAAPISNASLNHLKVTYGPEGGYTPGDSYDVYFDDEHQILEWQYQNGKREEVKLATTWENYQDFGGLLLATEHKDSSGQFRLYFTDLDVKY